MAASGLAVKGWDFAGFGQTFKAVQCFADNLFRQEIEKGRDLFAQRTARRRKAQRQRQFGSPLAGRSSSSPSLGMSAPSSDCQAMMSPGCASTMRLSHE